MEYRTLGRTGLEVSAVGLGTEYLMEEPTETIVAVVHEAVTQGINYFDVVAGGPALRDATATAFRGRRDQVLLTAHLGGVEENGQYKVTRDPMVAEDFFIDYLRRFDTEHVDVLFLHNNNSREDWERITEPGGLLDVARRLRREGKARFIGLSGHNAESALQAVESGYIDVLMFPVNLAGHVMPGRAALLDACLTQNIGLVAMKPYAGGNLLRRERTIYAAHAQIGRAQMKGPPTRFEKTVTLSAAQCLSYALSQAGVSTAVPGCKDLNELSETLAYRHVSDNESDFAGVLSSFNESVTGQCVYCNHCLPCPVAIDIGKTLRLVDEAHERRDDVPDVDFFFHGNRSIQRRSTATLRSDYEALPVKASQCVECGDCVERCPFGVDVIAKMNGAVEIYETGL